MTYDAIVIGGGAAGLFCAITSGRRGRRVLVIEHNAECGRKIIISGGGRCNFTNIGTSADNFVSDNPHFAKSALARLTPEDFIGLVRSHRIEYYEKKLGQLFCRGSSRQIVEMLLAECRAAGVKILTGAAVSDVRQDDPRFVVETSAGEFGCGAVVVAAGGLSFPKIGASDIGYRIARRFGLSIIPTRPSLVPLVAAGGRSFAKLAGISVDAEVSGGGRSFRENILFTHRGMSGPAILQVSNYWEPGRPLEIDLLPGEDAADSLAAARSSRQRLDNFLSRSLPARFAEAIAAAELPNKPLNELSNKDIELIGRTLNRWQIVFDATEGYAKAEVTLGGVATSELSSQTMMSKKVGGLYFIGEVVDVTGWLGGYNFQWAWASANAAGLAL